MISVSHHSQRGITLLLVVVLTSAILSISVGMFNVLIGEFRISGDAGDSFRAFYAADHGVERILYRDRQQAGIADGFTATDVPLASGACYTARVSKTGSPVVTTIIIAGQYQCGSNPVRVVKRGIEVIY